jgi:vacuolar-type H+-ATPase subunit B/Vma2
MVIADDANNNCDALTLRTISIEYNIIPSRIHQYSHIYTNWDDNRLT